MRPSTFLGCAPDEVLEELKALTPSTQVKEQEKHDSLPAKLPQSMFRPPALKVQSLQERASQYVEHWSHTDEDGFHLPLTSPAIQSVRSKVESLPVASTPSQAAQALRQSQDKWYQLPPPTPAVQSVRASQDAWTRPSSDAAVAKVRQMQEEFFPGVNDVASVAVAAASRRASLRTASVASRGASSAAASAFHASAAMPAPLLGHSPLLSVTSGTESTAPEIQVLRDACDGSAPQGASPVEGEDTGLITAQGAAQPLSDATLAGASVWGACAGQVHAALGLGEASGSASSVAGVSAVGEVLSHAAAVAAVRHDQEDTWHKPSLDPAITTIREQEELSFRQPSTSSKVQAVRRQANDFRSEPTSPAVNYVRAGEEQWRTLAGTRSQPAARAMAACLEDPFGRGRVWSGERRAPARTVSVGPGSKPCNAAALARNISVPHPQMPSARDVALASRVSNQV